jgi:peroxiredoxin
MLIHDMSIGLALAWAVILAGGWLGWQLLRQNGRLLLRLEELEKRLDELEFGEHEQPAGLPIGSDAPVFELPDLAGESKTLAQYRGRSVLLILFNPACGFCRDLLPKLAAISACPLSEDKRLLSSRLSVLIVTTGDNATNRQLFNEHKLDHPVLLQKETEVASVYKANGTPSGYLISSEGKIASELTIGAEALLEIATEPRSSHREGTDTSVTQPLVSNGHGADQSLGTSAVTSRFSNRSLARSKIKRDGLKAGTPAPDFRLPRLDGRGELSLSEFRGQHVLLVFSSPRCGPCNTLAPELEKFHREQRRKQASPSPQPSPPGEGKSRSGVEVVMISKGEPKENQAKVKEHGLTFPVVLQQQWEISRRYAMFATPIAYLIDETGVVAHDVAVGADAVLELLAQVSRGWDIRRTRQNRRRWQRFRSHRN